MAKGFISLDEDLKLPPVKGCDFIQVEFGHLTGWRLVAEVETEAAPIWLVVDHPIGHRVHQEGELLAYWSQIDQEGVPPSFGYEITESVYLAEMRGGVSGLMGVPLRHFLFGGRNTCIEIIASETPVISATKPDGATRPWPDGVAR